MFATSDSRHLRLWLMVATLIVLPTVSVAALGVATPASPRAASAAPTRPPVPQQQSFLVDSTIDATDATPGDGRCATVDGACTLRAAVREANSQRGPVTIRVPAGTYRLTVAGVDDETGDLDLAADITIFGEAGRNATIVSTDVPDRIVHVHPGATVTIAGLTLEGGRDVEQGGGVLNERGALTLRDCAVLGNTVDVPSPTSSSGRAGDGGGIANNNGRLEIVRTIVRGNRAAYEGGGIYNEALDGTNGFVRLVESAVSDNEAGYTGGAIASGGWGGDAVVIVGSEIARNRAQHAAAVAVGSWGHSALHVRGSRLADNVSVRDGGAMSIGGWGVTSATIESSVISDNTAGYAGGGLEVGSHGCTTVTIEGSLISGNTSEYGGGLDVGDFGITAAHLSNSTLSGNTATIYGGALAVTLFYTHGNSSASLRHVTLADNHGASGSSVYAATGSGSRGATVTYRSTIFAGRGAHCVSAPGSTLLSLGNNLGQDGSCQLSAGGDRANIDPLLALLADNGGPTFTHALLPGSPAIDGADASSCPATDQRAAPRPAGAGCDVGAFESEAIAPPAPSTWPLPAMPYVPVATSRGRVTGCEWPRAPVGPDPTPDLTLPAPTLVPTATPPQPAASDCICDVVFREVPAAALQDALQHPERYDGWGKRVDPGKPASPANPLRMCLTLLNPNVHYHRWYNNLVWRGSCP